jgi:CheY-like chemotaxis protein
VSDIPSLVLVIEDDAAMRRFLRASLAAAGYRVAEAETGDAGLKQAPLQPPDVVLLDLGLPDMDGLEVIRNLRTWSQVPIVVVSARGQEKDKVAALDVGADDYLTKPFSVGELLARIRVAMRHAARIAAGGGAEATQFTVADLKVDLAARRIFLADKEVHLVGPQQAGGVAVGDLQAVLALELAPRADLAGAVEQVAHYVPLKPAVAGGVAHPGVDALAGIDAVFLADEDAG